MGKGPKRKYEKRLEARKNGYKQLAVGKGGSNSGYCEPGSQKK